jgi:hypothetical protein
MSGAAGTRLKSLIGLSVLSAAALLTPAAGQTATPSELRQQNEYAFKVLGFGRSRLQETRFELRGERHRLNFGAQFAKYKGAPTLAEPFHDSAHRYETGELINAKIKKTWKEMNYLTHLEPRRLLGRQLDVALGAGVALLEFDYRLGSDDNETLEKHSDIGYRLASEFEWRVGQRLTLSSLVYLPVPVPDTPSILTLDLMAGYELMRFKNTRLTMLAGVAYHRVRHPDSMPVPDQIQLLTRPLFKFGLALSL